MDGGMDRWIDGWWEEIFSFKLYVMSVALPLTGCVTLTTSSNLSELRSLRFSDEQNETLHAHNTDHSRVLEN